MILLYCLKFLTFLVFFALPLGQFLLSKIKLSEKSLPRKIVLGVTFGLWLLGLQIFVLGVFLPIDLVAIILFVQSVYLWILYRREMFPGKVKINLVVFLTLILITVLNALINVPFGVLSDTSPIIGGVHSIDSSWHLALIGSAKQGLPLANPIFSGTALANYHYLFDLQLSAISTMARIPSDVLFYRLVPPLYIFMFAYICYFLGKKFTKTQFGGIAFALLATLASNWYYLAKLVFPDSYVWPSVAWVDVFSTKSVNYQLLFSFILFFAVLYLLLVIKKNNLFSYIFYSIVLGSIMLIKSPLAIVVIGAVGLTGTLGLIKRDKSYLLIGIGSVLVGGVFTILTYHRNMIMFSPLWFVRTMYETKDHLNHVDWELRRQFLLSVGATKGLVKLYAEGISTFILINLGPLLFGFFAIFMKFDAARRRIVQLLALSALGGVVASLLFINYGVAFNTIQFFYVVVPAISFLFVILLNKIYLKNKVLGVLVFALIFASTLPGVFLTLEYYSPSRAGKVSPDVVAAAKFLQSQPYGRVLVSPQHNGNSFVSAYTEKPVYFAEETLLNVVLVDFTERKTEVEKFFTCHDQDFMKNLLSKNELKYVWASASDKCLGEQDYLEAVHSGNEIVIYKVI